MIAGFLASYFCIKAFSKTDLAEYLKKFDVPTLILHGNDGQKTCHPLWTRRREAAAWTFVGRRW